MVYQAKAKASRSIDPKYVMYYCFSGQYVLHVLKNGFRFDSTSSEQWFVNFGDGITTVVSPCSIMAPSVTIVHFRIISIFTMAGHWGT